MLISINSIFRILPLAFFLLAGACNKEESDTGLDCEKLKQGIYHAREDSFSNDSLLQAELDKLTKDLLPEPTVADPHGQLANLYTLFTRLQKCPGISLYICCYACIQTAPPQTEVAVSIDSAGVRITRVFDFLTGGNSKLAFAGAHGPTQLCR